jgi:hypothetical protein
VETARGSVQSEPGESPSGESEPRPSSPARSEPLDEAWTESVIELMDASTEEAGPSVEPPAELAEEISESRGERRRRKRRRRGRRPPEGRDDETAVPPGPREPFGSVLDTESVEPEPEAAEAAESSAEAPAAGGEPQAPGRSRRRRRRRGDKRREREPDKAASDDLPREGGREASASEPSGTQPQRRAEADAGEPDEDPFADEHEEDSEDGEEKGDKDGHRAIPNWQEAISYIVDKNLESRARRPDSGSFRPRGRGRGRG